AEMGKLMEDMAKAGVLIAADGLQPSSKGKRIKFSGGKITAVRDGPFTESKELVAGFCMIDVKSWDEALAWTRRFAQVEGEGETELRPLYEASDFPPEVFSPEDASHEQALRDELQRKVAKR
ncbi:MAG: YciI family protein, partial [Gemmatimonadetes bacterium]|nr:YciI family protein [Gemmatimonadota bacterium]